MQLNDQWQNEPDIAQLPLSWLPWILAARFEVAPSAGKLAVALINIADALPQAEWQTLKNCASWPLAVCLRAANNPADLRKFAQQAQSGVLGDAPEWLAAEKGWRGGWLNMLRLDEMINPLWSIESIQRLPPLLSTQDIILIAYHQNINIKSIDFLKIADQAMAASGSHNLQNLLLGICRHLIGRGKLDQKESECYIVKWLRQFTHAGIFLLPRPSFMPQQAWLDALDVVDDSVFHRQFYAPEILLSALIEAKGHPKILRLVIQTICMAGQAVKLADVKAFLHKFQQPVTDSAGVDWRILQLWAGLSIPEQDDVLLNEIAATSQRNPAIWNDFITILNRVHLPQPRLAALLAKLWANPDAKQFIAYEIIDLMRKQLQTRQSGLANHTTWNRLALPLPFPLQTQTQVEQGALPSNPVHIASLELKNIRVLHHLKLAFPAPQENCGQWVVILGENGVGKTTLLRSLALALRNAANRAIWPPGVFSINWLRTADNQETQVGQAEIVLTLGSGERHTTTIRQNGTTRTSTDQQPEQDRTRLFPLFGYGCRRSALGGATREVKLSDNDGPEISTLFDNDGNLIHVETWLRILESDAQKDTRFQALFETVKVALITFLDLADVEIRVGDGLWVTEKTGLKFPFKDLSDGYLTSAGWFLDLIARWIELAKQNQAIIEADFMTQMRGLVLIDEIDLHLHPRWQLEIINRTRKLLPQMSFIVTTHNPLTLVGAKAQEIWKLERDDNGRIQAKIQGDTPMLLTGGQIYRRYFGIEDIYPNGLGTDLQRYSFLTGFALRTDAEQAELEDLGKRLDEANIKPDWDIAPREIIPIAADMPVPVSRRPRAKKAKEAK